MSKWGPALFRALVLTLLLLSLTGLAGLALTVAGEAPTSPPIPSAGSDAGVIVPTPDPTLGARSLSGVPPVRIRAPRMGLDASVMKVGIGAGNVLETPADGTAVGWYGAGASPGDAGSALFDGHLDTVNGPAVFWRLHELEPGDEVTVIRQDGGVATFIVDRVDSYPYDATVPDLFALTGPPQLSLVTCYGRWDAGRQTYLKRLVVHATMTGISFTG